MDYSVSVRHHFERRRIQVTKNSGHARRSFHSASSTSLESDLLPKLQNGTLIEVNEKIWTFSSRFRTLKQLWGYEGSTHVPQEKVSSATSNDFNFYNDFSVKIKKKFYKKNYFSKTKSFQNLILRGLNQVTKTHFSAKFEPNRRPTVRTLNMDCTVQHEFCALWIGVNAYHRFYEIQ